MPRQIVFAMDALAGRGIPGRPIVQILIASHAEDKFSIDGGRQSPGGTLDGQFEPVNLLTEPDIPDAGRVVDAARYDPRRCDEYEGLCCGKVAAFVTRQLTDHPTARKIEEQNRAIEL